MPACANCTNDIPPATRKGGKPRKFCSTPCQIKHANGRRCSTRAGRSPTNPHGKAPGRPVASGVITIPPDPSTPLSDAVAARISALTTLANSRGGIDPWQVAELAKLKGRSPWAPLRVILAP